MTVNRWQMLMAGLALVCAFTLLAAAYAQTHEETECSKTIRVARDRTMAFLTYTFDGPPDVLMYNDASDLAVALHLATIAKRATGAAMLACTDEPDTMNRLGRQLQELAAFERGLDQIVNGG